MPHFQYMIPKVKKIKMGTLTGRKIKTEDGKVERMECQQNTSDACNWLARQWCLRHTGSVACNLHKLFFQLIRSPFRRIVHNLFIATENKEKGKPRTCTDRALCNPSEGRSRLVPDARTWHGAHQPLRPRHEFPRHRRLLAAARWRRYPEHQAAVEERHLAAFLVGRQLQPAALAWRAAGGQKQAEGKDCSPHCPHWRGRLAAAYATG
jgi:hypothetical protein